MPRSPRVEYEGAVYHVMCRGDRREPIFKDDDDRRMFLATLATACERAGWIIHAYVLMPNHYHLLLETPRAGLVDGMRWFQTTYTARFNARHRVCGHLFQGRYKAIATDPSEPAYLRTLGDYIHLNPARARLLPKDAPLRLEAFPWSSYPAYLRQAARPPWLETARLLAAAGLTRPAYARYMQRRLLDLRGDRAAAQALAAEWKDLRRGWAIGGDDFRQELLHRIDEKMAPRRRDSYSGPGPRDCDRQRAQALLQKGLATLRLDLEELRKRKNTDPAKQALIWLLRTATRAPADWICTQLAIGHRSNLSRAVRALDATKDPARKRLKRKMQQIKD